MLISLLLFSFSVTIVSPRNYFTFTPLLPSVASGTMSPLSTVEPVRNFTRTSDFLHSRMFESVAESIDFDNQKVSCITEAGDSFSVNINYFGYKNNYSLIYINKYKYQRLLLLIVINNRKFQYLFITITLVTHSGYFIISFIALFVRIQQYYLSLLLLLFLYCFHLI